MPLLLTWKERTNYFSFIYQRIIAEYRDNMMHISSSNMILSCKYKPWQKGWYRLINRTWLMFCVQTSAELCKARFFRKQGEIHYTRTILDNLWCIDRPINKLNINKTINKLNNKTWDRWYFIYQIVLIIIIMGLK